MSRKKTTQGWKSGAEDKNGHKNTIKKDWLIYLDEA
jgi:hypothetical protein